MQRQTGRNRRPLTLLKATSALSSTIVVALGLTSAAVAQTVAAAPPPTDTSDLDEVVVTGSRIVREGYEAPTPVSVISEDQLKSNAETSIVNILSQQPVFSGSTSAKSSTYAGASGGSGLNSLNLRSLGVNRTLVLLDGRRLEPASSANAVDVSSLPTQLISRVDVVTGGASAVYGSDAVAGVVNFVLDRDFVGVRGDVNAGLTTYGDNESYSLSLAGGFAFAAGRGHVLLSGEYSRSDRIEGRARPWARMAPMILTNPNYTPTNGQPLNLHLTRSAYITGTPGGIVLNSAGGLFRSGPLERIEFGQGGAVVTIPSYGDIIGTNGIAHGGDWEKNDQHISSIAPEETRRNVFANVSYDLSDSVTAFAQWSWASSSVDGVQAPVYRFGTQGPLIRLDNALLPASVRSSMIAAGVTTIRVGTFNQDLGTIDNDADRISQRFAAGLEGSLDAFGSSWNWTASFGRGETRAKLATLGNISVPKYLAAIDVIENPVTGAIECRTLATNPGCSPWNVFGIGVNDPNGAGFKYVHSPSISNQRMRQDLLSANIVGEPFSVPAGPVSVAIDVEHRRNSTKMIRDADSESIFHQISNSPLVNGKTHVTEGAFETVVPIAKDEAWADTWDVTAAGRYTSYNLAGDVVTWKLGSTYSPIPDLKLRVSRSRDIRAPSAVNNFNTGTTNQAPQDDPKYNVRPIIRLTTRGNVNLRPERSDNFTFGAVVQPTFLEGVSFSADYWKFDIKDVLSAVSVQNVINYCVSGARPDFCGNITRDPVTDQIVEVVSSDINFAFEKSRGLDLEASYQTPLDGIGLAGELAIHGNMTFTFKQLIDTGLPGVPPIDYVGENGSTNPQKWKLNVTGTYSLDPVRFSLTARAVPGGKMYANYIECTSGCPTSTPLNPTMNTNWLPGAFYLDAALNYDIDLGSATGAVYLNVKNVLDRDPPSFFGVILMSPPTALNVYESTGRTFRAGLRFRL